MRLNQPKQQCQLKYIVRQNQYATQKGGQSARVPTRRNFGPKMFWMVGVFCVWINKEATLDTDRSGSLSIAPSFLLVYICCYIDVLSESLPLLHHTTTHQTYFVCMRKSTSPIIIIALIFIVVVVVGVLCHPQDDTTTIRVRCHGWRIHSYILSDADGVRQVRHK